MTLKAKPHTYRKDIIFLYAKYIICVVNRDFLLTLTTEGPLQYSMTLKKNNQQRLCEKLNRSYDVMLSFHLKLLIWHLV